MSKRSKKDIRNTSAKLSVTRSDTNTLPADQSHPAAGNEEVLRKTTNTLLVDASVLSAEDPDLDGLLGQVDQMLTEMTQSKWLSSDWPTLEIDFGNSKK